MKEPIILASQSPRRSQLLTWAEIPFTVQVSDTDESYPAGLSYADTAIHIARNKAVAVAEKAGRSAIILAADTIVVCDGNIIGKPVNRADALRILSILSGNTHQVITGVVILHPGGEDFFSDTTEVFFHDLTTEQLTYYVDQYKPYDKAGAYAIQEWIGVTGIRCINGDFYNVMGLPVSRVVKALALLGK